MSDTRRAPGNPFEGATRGNASALVFPTEFFPKDLPPIAALLASFSTFAVGFIARPVGAVLFGHFGDRAGRKTALVAALTLMGIATTLIGLLPPYGMIGVLAPILLVVLRFAQGLAIGGQWGGAVLLIVESAPADRRGFYSSFAQAGVQVGVLLAREPRWDTRSARSSVEHWRQSLRPRYSVNTTAASESQSTLPPLVSSRWFRWRF